MPEIARLQADVQHLTQLVESGFKATQQDIAKVDGRLETLNGTVREHESVLIEQSAEQRAQEKRLGVLESWRNTLMANLVRGTAQGVSAVVVVIGILFGVGKATGWW